MAREATASLDTGGWDPECKKTSDETREVSRDQDTMSLTSHAEGSRLYPEGSREPWKVLGQSDLINYAMHFRKTALATG